MKLHFQFMPNDDTLEARTDNGNYYLYQAGDSFNVSCFLNEKSIDVANSPNIYAALTATNEHYANSQQPERQTNIFSESDLLSSSNQQGEPE